MQEDRNYHLTKGEKVSMWILRLAEEGRFCVLDDMFTCQISAAIANIYLGTACDKEKKMYCWLCSGRIYTVIV